MATRLDTKMVPIPSTGIVPERDAGKMPVLVAAHLGITFGGLDRKSTRLNSSH